MPTTTETSGIDHMTRSIPAAVSFTDPFDDTIFRLQGQSDGLQYLAR